jgi:hypothetical protein
MFTMIGGSSVARQTESDIRDQIVGTWKLVSTEETMKDGTTRPFPVFGAQCKGFLLYQSDGYMCAYLVNPDRLQWADPAHPTSEEKLAAAEGTFAYCGRYEIDVKQKQIVHLPEVATNPGYIGSREIRPFTLQDGRLILSDVEKNDPKVARWKIVWEKAQ